MEAQVLKLLTDVGPVGAFGLVVILICRLGLVPLFREATACLTQWTVFQDKVKEPLEIAIRAFDLATERLRDIAHDLASLGQRDREGAK